MNPSPRVSIVVINYNYERFVDISISSALDQTYGDVEVIVVDDASTDSSPQVVRSYGDRITAVLKSQNAGHGAAFNTGFQASTGDIIVFLDSDDHLHPDGVARIVEAFTEGVVQVQSRLDLIDGEGAHLDIYPAPEIPFDNGDVVPLLMERGRYNTTVTSGLAFSRAVLAQIMPMSPVDFVRGGDGYLVTVAPLFGKVVSIETPTGAYRLHGGNHSQFGSKLAERARWRVEHDLFRYKALALFAKDRGLTLSPQPGLRDPVHLEERLLSLTCASGVQICPGDTRLSIAMHGVKAVGSARMSRSRKLVLQAWYAVAGLAPRKIAFNLVAWKLSAASRPKALTNLFKMARSAIG